MKIAFITDKIFPYYIGGYETRYWELATRLSEKHDVHVFTSCPQDTVLKGVKFHKIVPPYSYVNENGYRVLSQDILYSIQLLKKISAKADYIDCNSTPFTYIPSAYIISKASNARLGITVHEAFQNSLNEYFKEVMSKQNNIFNPIYSSSLPLRYINWSLNLADDIIAVSGITADVLKKGFNIKNPKVIPNGVSLDKTNIKNTGSGNKNSIVYLGRLSPEKCITDLIYAVDHLRNNGNPNILCQIIGDGPEKHQLMKLTRDLNLANHIIFHGYLPEYSKYKILCSSDLYVLPSKREGFSIATMEALSCGLPVIAAKPNHLESSGVFEYLIDGYNGFSYQVNDYFELSKKISYLLSDLVNLDHIQINAKKTAENYSWDKVLEVYNNFIEG